MVSLQQAVDPLLQVLLVSSESTGIEGTSGLSGWSVARVQRRRVSGEMYISHNPTSLLYVQLLCSRIHPKPPKRLFTKQHTVSYTPSVLHIPGFVAAFAAAEAGELGENRCVCASEAFVQPKDF